MRTGRPTVAIVLTDAERKHLESLARRSRTSPQVALREALVEKHRHLTGTIETACATLAGDVTWVEARRHGPG